MMANKIFHNRWGLVGLTLLTLAFTSVANNPAHAMMMANNAGAIRDCSPLMRMAEAQYGIPDRLLQAIAYAESGRTDPKNGRRVAWPWTINAEGDGFVFDSKAAAINRVRALRQQGVESIDVGCMQVNLIHHADAFDNLEQAFEPAYNIDYAARFLKSLQQETGSWAQAVAFYHSRNQNISDGYRQKVLSLWQKTRPDGMVAGAKRTQPAVLAANATTTTASPATINNMANARYRALAVGNQGMGVSNPRLAMGSRVDAPRPINGRYRLAMGTPAPNQMQASSSLQGQLEGQA
ncbi:MAG: lytic transglycosylase domain-containing protein, partial [Alphaproteobacteria bacterium]|nr:lytic transglycosylase domain-containing protein [Alphaproteobacteria bacterium]